MTHSIFNADIQNQNRLTKLAANANWSFIKIINGGIRFITLRKDGYQPKGYFVGENPTIKSNDAKFYTLRIETIDFWSFLILEETKFWEEIPEENATPFTMVLDHGEWSYYSAWAEQDKEEERIDSLLYGEPSKDGSRHKEPKDTRFWIEKKVLEGKPSSQKAGLKGKKPLDPVNSWDGLREHSYLGGLTKSSQKFIRQQHKLRKIPLKGFGEYEEMMRYRKKIA